MIGAPPDSSPLVAAVDVGSDSTRLLIGRIAGERVEPVARRSAVTRAGAGTFASRHLADSTIGRVLAVLDGYRDEIERAGCVAARAVLTSAARDADNGDELRALVERRCGFEALLIDGRTEAELAFRGATAGRDPDEPTVVVDVGGGSTELVVGGGAGARLGWASTDAGVVRLSERFLADPPRPAQIDALRVHVRAAVRDALPEPERRAVRTALVVADAESWQDALARFEGALDRATLDRALAAVGGLDVAALRGIDGLDPERAPTIVAGIAVLIEVADAFGLDRLEIAEHDLLTGVLLTLAEDLLATGGRLRWAR